MKHVATQAQMLDTLQFALADWQAEKGWYDMEGYLHNATETTPLNAGDLRWILRRAREKLNA